MLTGAYEQPVRSGIYIILGSPANGRPFTNVIRIQSSNPRFSQDGRTGYYFLPTGLGSKVKVKVWDLHVSLFESVYIHLIHDVKCQ